MMPGIGGAPYTFAKLSVTSELAGRLNSRPGTCVREE